MKAKRVPIKTIIVCFVVLLLGFGTYGISQSILFTPRLSLPRGAPQVGMSKAQVVQMWGSPHHVEMQGTPDELWAYYEDTGMFSWLMPIYISFDSNGNVESVWS